MLAPVGCKSHTQDVATDIGGGMKKGTPPMCFQYRSEVRATTSAYDVWLHLNNTCGYPVTCTFFDDATEKEYEFKLAAYQNHSEQVADEVETKRVDFDAECVWKP